MTEREAFEKWAQGRHLDEIEYLRYGSVWEQAWRACAAQVAAADEGRERKWISVLDQLPEMDSRFVLVFRPDYDCDSLETDVTTAQGQALWDSFREFGKGVTHWMELPGKPAERDTTPPQPAKTLPTIEEMCGSIDFAGWPLPKATPPQEVAAEPHIEIHKFIPPDDRWIIGKAAEEDNADVLAAAPEVAVPAEPMSPLAISDEQMGVIKSWADDRRNLWGNDEARSHNLTIIVRMILKLEREAAERENATLRERNEELQKALQLVLEELNTGWTSHTGQRIRAMVDYTLAPSAERKPEVKG